jgi:DNA-binding transcriptional regulator YiaG
MSITLRRPRNRSHDARVVSYVGPSPSSANAATANRVYYDADASTARLLAAVDDVIDEINRVIPTRQPSSADRMKKLHDHTALTWAQIARLFGVSRRAVHLWATGQRMAAGNLERLARIEEVVEGNAASAPEETKANLFARHNGESAFSMLLAEVSSARPKSEADAWADRQPSD